MSTIEEQQKWIVILQNAYSGDAVLARAAASAVRELQAEDRDEEFQEFKLLVSKTYEELLADLDKGLTELADSCPDESDPRKWSPADWATFEVAVAGHPYADIYRTMGQGINNVNLIWGQIKDRLELSEF